MRKYRITRADAPGMAWFSPRFWTRRGAERAAERRNQDFPGTSVHGAWVVVEWVKR